MLVTRLGLAVGLAQLALLGSGRCFLRSQARWKRLCSPRAQARRPGCRRLYDLHAEYFCRRGQVVRGALAFRGATPALMAGCTRKLLVAKLLERWLIASTAKSLGSSRLVDWSVFFFYQSFFFLQYGNTLSFFWNEFPGGCESPWGFRCDEWLLHEIGIVIP